MEEECEMVSRLQRGVANDVIIKNYHYIVGCVNAILIFPYLVSSRMVQHDFRQYLDGERTDKDKMMALLRELTRSPQETWFKEFIGALSRFPQYETVVDHLLKDFTELMGEMQDRTQFEDAKDRRSQEVVDVAASTPVPAQLVINVTGVNEVMKKALEDAKAGHDAALSELQKATSLVLKAEQDKAHAEAENCVLRERVQEGSKKLNEANKRLRVTEMDKRLFEEQAQSYKEEIKENMQRMELEKMQLAGNLAEVCLQEEAARKRLQELEEEKAALEKQVAGLQADVARVTREIEEEVSSLKQQLSDANIQQQTLKRELKALWQETGKHKMEATLDHTREELDLLQSHQDEDLPSLRVQLASSVTRTAALQGELDEANSTKEGLEEVIRGLRKELMAAKKQDGRGHKHEQKKARQGKGEKTQLKKTAPEESDVEERTRLQQLEEELISL